MLARIEVREETAGDRRAIEAIHRAAFGGDAEARLVEALAAARPRISRVAVTAGRVIGHILFTAVAVERAPAGARVMGLAPMAVLPEMQRRGVGGRLIEAGLAACAAVGVSAVVVLGHAAYYPRFGFEPAARYSLMFGEPAAEPHFFVRAIAPGGLDGLGGRVRYRPEFDAL